MLQKNKIQSNANEKIAKDSGTPISVQAAEFMLSTLEKRREQIITKSTIILTANSVLVVGILSYILYATNVMVIAYGILMMGLVFSSFSLVFTLDIIKKLNRKTRKIFSRDHLLFFGWIADQKPSELTKRLLNLDLESYLKELSIQSISLSKNLVDRYTKLSHAYKTFIIGLVCFSLAVLFSEVTKRLRSTTSNIGGHGIVSTNTAISNDIATTYTSKNILTNETTHFQSKGLKPGKLTKE